MTLTAEYYKGENMNLKIAIAGNPNCGKTTLFNALTGSNQFVGNWPGVTVEKKEGALKHREGVTVVDLPGVYSLSPYTLEEVVARDFLVNERPDAILNIVDATNIERNLYLTTQLTELGIPVVIALNMMDIVIKNGDSINVPALSSALGCRIVEISALKGKGIDEAAEAAIEAAMSAKCVPIHRFSGAVEHAIAHIEEAALHDLGLPSHRQRWYAIKIFERDEKALAELDIDKERLLHIEEDIKGAERELDDDAESIITNERYLYIEKILKNNYKKHKVGRLSVSDKIDRIVTNRFAALPIFALIMFLVYFISVTTVGTWATDFANDGLFGDGFHLMGVGKSDYEEKLAEYATVSVFHDEVVENTFALASEAGVIGANELLSAAEDRDLRELETLWGIYAEAVLQYLGEDAEAFGNRMTLAFENAPTPDSYGVWVPGVPVAVSGALRAVNCAPWLESLIVDGIVGGVGAVLGFVPQILVLFILLAFLEACGYMSRIAFVMDKIFRKLGLSGKSFIPMLIGTGCSVPGIMASRTIENERDRRMTIMTTPFVPCGAKLPVIALISGALFDNAWWVAPTAYFVGIGAVVISGIMLKKTKLFIGEPAPFVMELPAYHMPTFINIMRSMWERGWAFIKKAGTVILLSTIVIWFADNFGIYNGEYAFLGALGEGAALDISILDALGTLVGWIFIPLGFAGSETAIATIMGLVAKEEIVAVLGVLDFVDMSRLAAFSFLVFNLLCAPCIASIAAIRREMNSTKWMWIAIGYQTAFAYATSLCIYQLGMLFTGHFGIHILGGIVALAIIGFVLYMLLMPYDERGRFNKK